MSNTSVRKFRGSNERIIDLLEKDERKVIEDMKPFSSESSVSLVGGLGGADEGGGLPANAEGIYLPLAGGQMKGPIAYNPILREISSGVLDVRKTVGAFTGRVIINSEGGPMFDDLDQILGEKIPGTQLSIQGTTGEIITIKHLALGGGQEDIRVPGGKDFFLIGEDNVTLIYDGINNEWTFMDSAIIQIAINQPIITPVKHFVPAPAVNLDLSLHQHFTLPLVNNISITFTGLPPDDDTAEQIVIELIQDAAGGRTTAFTDTIVPALPVLDTAPLTTTVLTGFVRRHGGSYTFRLWEVGNTA